MPLRFLLYLAELYSSMIAGKNIYGSKRILIPAPRFVVFYNGIDEKLDYEILKLSDLYEIQDEKNSLELLVDMLNINKGHNKELMKSCKTLCDYAEYVYRVREYAKNMAIEDAVEQAITECIQGNILKEFLEKNRREVMKYSIYEYNYEEHMRMEREDCFEDGRIAGIEEGKKVGREEGREEIRGQLLKLIQKMTKDGMLDSIPRLAVEPDFYDNMLSKYSL